MAGVRFSGIHRLDIHRLDIHQTWEDWATITLGIVIVVSPWLAGTTEPLMVVWNTFLIGMVVAVLGAFELIRLERWEEGAQILCGLWLIASPFNVGYGGALRMMHFILGALVILLAIVELVQDWRFSEEQLSRRGE